MTYITVHNLPFNSNCRILAAELNCTFTYHFTCVVGVGHFFRLRLHSCFKFRLQPKPPIPGDSDSATLIKIPVIQNTRHYSMYVAIYLALPNDESVLSLL